MKICEKLWSGHRLHNYHRLHLNKFHFSYHNVIVDDGKIIYNFKILKMNSCFEKNKFIHFVNVESGNRLR